MAKHILSEPEEITTMNGQKLPLRMQVGARGACGYGCGQRLAVSNRKLEIELFEPTQLDSFVSFHTKNITTIVLLHYLYLLHLYH